MASAAMQIWVPETVGSIFEALQASRTRDSC